MPNAFSLLLARLARPQLLLSPGPAPLPVSYGCRVRIWNGQLGVFLGWTRENLCTVALDGERTVDGRQRTDEWQRIQIEALPVARRTFSGQAHP